MRIPAQACYINCTHGAYIFTGINRELPYTGLSIVDAETTTDDVNIVIIQYYAHVTASSGGLGDVSGVCNADLTY